MNPGVWELKREVLCNSSQLMSLEPVLWPTGEAKGRGACGGGKDSDIIVGSEAQHSVFRMRSGRTKRCVWARARALSLQRWCYNPKEGSPVVLKTPCLFWASPALNQSFCGLPSPSVWRWGFQASSSSVFRNGRVGATDTHRYPAAYYFLPVLAPLQRPAWQVDEIHERAPQWASFPGMLLLTRLTDQATPHHPRLNGEPAEWGRVGVFFLFFFSLVSSLDPVIVSAGISHALLRLQGSKCFLMPVFPNPGPATEDWKEGQVPLG